MRLEVLTPEWTPPRLVHREDKPGELKRALKKGRVLVVGPCGTGKSTLVKLALGETLRVDCSRARSAASVAARLAALAGVRTRRLSVALSRLLELEPQIIVLDDFTLARKDRSMILLLERLERRHVIVLVVHPHALRAPGVEGEAVIMPPYSAEELYGILENRVAAGGLPVSEEALWAIAEGLGHPHGPGSARLAIAALRRALELASRDGRPEVLERHAEVALNSWRGLHFGRP